MQNECVLIDCESVDKRRLPVDRTIFAQSRQGNFVCHFCSKRFKSELIFMKHSCEQKRRQQELHSPLGQSAFLLYRDWMRLRQFREQSSLAFLDSRFYRAFYNFAKLVQDANIVQPEKYIQLMIESDIQPTLWCRDSAYAIYLEWVDKHSDPLDQVKFSIEYLINLSEKENIPLFDIYDKLGSQNILSLIRQRKLSPWFLFQSKKFATLLHNLSKEELKAFNLIINSSFWAKKFQENKAIVLQIKNIVNELNL